MDAISICTVLFELFQSFVNHISRKKSRKSQWHMSPDIMTLHYFSDPSLCTVKIWQRMTQTQPWKCLKICQMLQLSTKIVNLQINIVQNCAWNSLYFQYNFQDQSVRPLLHKTTLSITSILQARSWILDILCHFEPRKFDFVPDENHKKPKKID